MSCSGEQAAIQLNLMLNQAPNEKDAPGHAGENQQRDHIELEPFANFGFSQTARCCVRAICHRGVLLSVQSITLVEDQPRRVESFHAANACSRRSSAVIRST